MRLAFPFVCLTLLSQIAFAQGETPNTAAPKAEESAKAEKKEEKKAEKAAEKVQVTGTRIKRVDVETAAPTTVLDKAAIEKTGATNLGEILKKSASLSPAGNFTGESRFVASGAATVDLLGLGASRTLVLLNGKRIPTSGSVEAVNIGNIPTGLIERIEIVAGANSAVYGADAVGGVVNIITKKRQDGGEVSVFKSSTIHPGGEETEITASQGFDVGSTNFNIGLGYKHRNSIDKRNRDLAFARDGFKYTGGNPPPGSYSIRVNGVGADGKAKNGVFEPSANCPTDSQIQTNPTQPAIFCAGLREDIRSELVPEQNNWYAATTFNSEIGSDTTLSGIVSYATNENTTRGSQWPRLSQDADANYVRISEAKAKELGIIKSDRPGVVSSVDIYGMNPDARMRKVGNTYQNYMAGLYLDTTVAEDVNLQFSASHTTNKLRGWSKNSVNTEVFADTLATSYNPVDPNRDVNAFNSIYRDLESRETSSYSSFDTFAGTDLVELPGGKSTIGVGAAYAYETFKLTPDAQDKLFSERFGAPLYEGTYADAGDGNRTTVSAYSEVFAPITKVWDMEGALRFDHFNDFSSRVNYGLGTKLKPFEFLALRGRAATSFKAPPLTYMHQQGGGGYQTVQDAANCQREKDNSRPCNGNDSSIYTDQPGTSDLNPETGKNYSAGFILEPIRGLSLISDYYWIDLEQTFGRDDPQKLVDKFYAQHPYEGGDVGVSSFDVDGNTVTTDDEGIITMIRRPYKNIGKTQVRALDTKLTYSVQLPAKSRAGFETQYFKMLSYKVKDNNESPLRQRVGFFGIPPWRLNNQVSFGMGDHDLVLASRTTARQWIDPEAANTDYMRGQKIGSYTEYDAVYGLTLPWNGSLQLGVNNIMDTIGGVTTDQSPGSEMIDPSTGTYSYVGRSYYARITQKF